MPISPLSQQPNILSPQTSQSSISCSDATRDSYQTFPPRVIVLISSPTRLTWKAAPVSPSAKPLLSATLSSGPDARKEAGPVTQFLRLLKTSPKLPLMFRMQVKRRSEKLSCDSHTQVKYSFLQFLGRPGYGRADSPRLFLSSLCLFSHPGLSSFSVKETSGLFSKGNGTEWLKEKTIPDGPEKAQCAHSPPVTALPEGHTMRSKVIPHKLFAMLN